MIQLPVSKINVTFPKILFGNRLVLSCVLVVCILMPNPITGRCFALNEPFDESSFSNKNSDVDSSESSAADTVEAQDEFDIFDRPTTQLDVGKKSFKSLSPQAKELVDDLGLQHSFDLLKRAHTSYNTRKSTDAKLNSVIVQYQISRALQRASLQMQDTFANIDGDLAQTNMLLAYASTKHERELLLTNVATFTGSGTFGLLDASTRLGGLSPTSDIFGILASATSILLPLISLRTPKYSNPRHNQPRLNMLSPLFESNSNGDGYQPIVWHYLNSIPPNSKSEKTRRDLLVESWKAYRGFGKETGAEKSKTVHNIVNAPFKQYQLTIDALKTRAELLIDIRALIQSMYRSLSEIDGAVSEI